MFNKSRRKTLRRKGPDLLSEAAVRLIAQIVQQVGPAGRGELQSAVRRLRGWLTATGGGVQTLMIGDRPFGAFDTLKHNLQSASSTRSNGTDTGIGYGPAAAVSSLSSVNG
jgi:ABC-type branched-subunit amino acid transport system substrate-binding protein